MANDVSTFPFGPSRVHRLLYFALWGAPLALGIACLIIASFKLAAGHVGHVGRAGALGLLGLVVVGAHLPARRVWFMLTKDRWIGTLTLRPGELVIVSPALLLSDWVIDEADVASIEWLSSAGATFTDQRGEAVGPEATRQGQTDRADLLGVCVSALPPVTRPVVIVRFTRRIVPPARWPRFVPTYARTMDIAPRAGRSVAAVRLCLPADRLDVKRALEAWGAHFPPLVQAGDPGRSGFVRRS